MHNSGLDWEGYLDGLVERAGSLTAVAEHVAARRRHTESIQTIERGLRRLRSRGNKQGGVWGQRLLRIYGLPEDIDERIRWMGQYHTRFTDLPASLGVELLRPWDQPPVTDSPARIWIHLGYASIALRRRDKTVADAHIDQAVHALHTAPVAAQIETRLVRAYRLARRDPPTSIGLLDEVKPLLDDAELRGDDRSCLRARWVDQVAWRYNLGIGAAIDYPRAEAMYRALPLKDVPPFARCRRENGLGWSRLNQGDRASAVIHARNSVMHAGDGGSLRLRAMALNLLANAAGDEEARAARARAVEIAKRLEDETLRLRCVPRQAV
ncbi:MAG: hypothetical protein AAFV53_07700 [Myxococcota bacterium]